MKQKKSGRPVFSLRRPCNICGEIYRAHTVFERFCGRCRQEEELLRFSDWLPEPGESLPARLSA
jgi:hypothetical protein